MTRPTTARSPDLLVKDKPIPLRLTQRELDEASEVSKKRGISQSSMARQAYRLGLPLLKAQPITKEGADA